LIKTQEGCYEYISRFFDGDREIFRNDAPLTIAGEIPYDTCESWLSTLGLGDVEFLLL